MSASGNPKLRLSEKVEYCHTVPAVINRPISGFALALLDEKTSGHVATRETAQRHNLWK